MEMNMILRPLLLIASVVLLPSISLAQSNAKPLYELRSYVSEPGRQGDVLKLISEGGVPYMAKHKIQLVGAWVPTEASDERVITLVSHKDKAGSDAAWAAFQGDEGWKEVLQKSTVDGKKPVKSFDRVFLTENDYSLPLEVKNVGGRVFELRTYVTTPGNLAGLNARFRNHTVKLFEKHGMNNLIYWSVLEGEKTTCTKLLDALSAPGQPQAEMADDLPATGNSLVYFLTHASQDAAKKSFDTFRKDADWDKARKESEAAAGGKSLTVNGGVRSLFLKPADFSPIK
jgi:hypothetical protein